MGRAPGELKIFCVAAAVVAALLVWGGPTEGPQLPPGCPTPSTSPIKDLEPGAGPPRAERVRWWRVSRSPARTTFDLSAAPANRFMTISNVGTGVVVAPRVVVNGQRDWFDVETLLAGVVDEPMPQRDKAVAIWRFLVANRLHDEPAHPGAELHDPIRLLNVYGYGFCDDVSSAFAVLCERAGVEARVTGLDGHVVAEARYDGAWHAFDVDLEVHYLGDDGVTIPSVDELHHRPDLVRRRPSPRLESTQEIAAMYASPNYEITEPREGKHAMSFTLRPGESLLRSWSGWGLYFCSVYPEEPDRYGNGRFRFSPAFDGDTWRAGAEVRGLTTGRDGGLPSLVSETPASGSVSWRFDSPYPLLDARVRVVGAIEGAGTIDVAFAVDPDGGWRSVRTCIDPGQVTANVPLRDRLRNGRGDPVYASGLRLVLSGGARVHALTFERDVQVAPASLPALVPGANEVTYRDASPARAVTVEFGYDARD